MIDFSKPMARSASGKRKWSAQNIRKLLIERENLEVQKYKIFVHRWPSLLLDFNSEASRDSEASHRKFPEVFDWLGNGEQTQFDMMRALWSFHLDITSLISISDVSYLLLSRLFDRGLCLFYKNYFASSTVLFSNLVHRPNEAQCISFVSAPYLTPSPLSFLRSDRSPSLPRQQSREVVAKVVWNCENWYVSDILRHSANIHTWHIGHSDTIGNL